MSQTLFLSRGGSVAVGNHAARRCRHSSVRAQTSNPPSPLAPSSLLPSSQHRALSQRHHGQRRGGRERLYVAAAGGNLGPSEEQEMPDAMTPERAREVLQVSASSSFEEILAQKQKQLNRVGGDQEKAMEVEAAYDLLFMQSMKKRLSGELEVSTGVRYADVPIPPKRTFQQRSGQQAGMGASSGASPQRPSWLPSLPSTGGGRGGGSSSAGQGLGVQVAAPRDTNLAATQAAVFAGLGAWGIVQAVLESPEAQQSETAGLQVALALGYAIYSLKENKRMPLGKAAGLSLACLTVGALVGNGVEAWLRVDIVPIGNFASPGVLVTEFIIAGLSAGAVFLV
uniref:Uncharacterized protein n=1 Tax=Dunaliella tertiolecta TaxID=3047 RepID=A0A7S3VJQ0_DUNTE|mmetsp:Transcript_20958/g.58303  ORF Transcript_20958/g.58303 Transcript_20958/m.58303 type:complete len:340 (+) Transcript_20958:178-1197(+)|eukprot:CAMPEP_0202357510 /NCGR_PEP_ID=MMETSP1126-20121109/11510_1 /ASSEMBLY_ACC=CAM_ASM_000457 /TAXON_ID=3047 /ORGANISM="Dunaliella tertiolecta, Strain CCMP1320" /LENGTH=339 /DNA_ID=CAMNT_0048950409 /DNA_START=57 /DNA_END=1076 /DNA_ORIENTATION=+